MPDNQSTESKVPRLATKPRSHLVYVVGWVCRLLLPLLLIFSFFLLYSDKMDAVMYDKQGVWLAWALIFLVIPILFGLTWRVWKIAKPLQAGYLLGAVSFMINGPVLGVHMDKREKRLLRTEGIKTIAVVTSSFHRPESRMYYSFYVNYTRYESFNVLNPHNYQVGDTIEILYRKGDPRMNRAAER